MPIADPATYRRLLAAAADGGYALPSINVTSSSAINGVLRGLTEAGADGIIGVGLGGARFAAGGPDRSTAAGAAALAAFVHTVADQYPITVALHTDHCPPDRVDEFLLPLVAESRRRVADGRAPLFGSHMFDGSHLPLAGNLERSAELLATLAELGILLELEIGLVGGVEDEIDNTSASADRLYTTPGEMVAVADALGAGRDGGYLLAASFGNVHGYQPPDRPGVELDLSVLDRGQRAIEARFGAAGRIPLVFHGGSGCSPAEFRTAIAHGVVKVNVDTDTQLAYTRAAMGALETDRLAILAVDGPPVAKSTFELTRWMGAGESAMVAVVAEVCTTLGGAGRSLSA